MMTMNFAPFILAFVLIASILSSAAGHRKTPRGLKGTYWDGEVIAVNVVNDELSEMGIQPSTETSDKGDYSGKQETSDKYGDIEGKGSESDKYSVFGVTSIGKKKTGRTQAETESKFGKKSSEGDKYSVLGVTGIGKKKTGRSKAETESMLEERSIRVLC
jgi:hypothetical protein